MASCRWSRVSWIAVAIALCAARESAAQGNGWMAAGSAARPRIRSATHVSVAVLRRALAIPVLGPGVAQTCQAALP